MTPEEYRMPATKKPFRDYLKGLPAEQLIAPGDILGCFFCGFVRHQLALPPGRNKVQFYWDSYQVGREKEHPLPEWAKKFTHDASYTVSNRAGGSRLSVGEALSVLRQC